MATKNLRDSKLSITAEKGWFAIRIEVPVKGILALISVVATALGYPTIIELIVKLLGITR